MARTLRLAALFLLVMSIAPSAQAQVTSDSSADPSDKPAELIYRVRPLGAYVIEQPDEPDLALNRPQQEALQHYSALLASLQQLQGRYEEQGLLDGVKLLAAQIQLLESMRLHDLPAFPEKHSNSELNRTPRELRGEVGTTVYLRATGRLDQSVWGDGIYTDDSDLGAAAVHAGFLQPGETAILEVRLLEGQDSYAGSETNGVRSHDWGRFSGSFEILEKGLELSDVSKQRGQQETLVVYVTGRSGGPVWGSDAYTDDSDLGTAAVHAGLLDVGQSGFVKLTVLPGLRAYTGSTRNGITSISYGGWGGSFVLSPARETEPDPFQGFGEIYRFLR